MRVKPTTPEHAGAVERLTAYAEWLRNSEPNSPYDASCAAKDDDIVAVLAALTASEARVLELVGALEGIANTADPLADEGFDGDEDATLSAIIHAARALLTTSGGSGA